MFLHVAVATNFDSVERALTMTAVKTVAIAGSIVLYMLISMLAFPITATQQVSVWSFLQLDIVLLPTSGQQGHLGSCCSINNAKVPHRMITRITAVPDDAMPAACCSHVAAGKVQALQQQASCWAINRCCRSLLPFQRHWMAFISCLSSCSSQAQAQMTLLNLQHPSQWN